MTQPPVCKSSTSRRFRVLIHYYISEAHGRLPVNETNTSGNYIDHKCHYYSPDSACDTSEVDPGYFTSTPQPVTQPSLCISHPDRSAKYPLPTFFHPLPSTLSTDDIEFLVIKRAVELPSLSLREPLLRAYIDHVHPYMPILNLHELVDTIKDDDGIKRKMSLLLYMAVMFSATFFVEFEHIYQSGYATRRAISQDFYNRTRLLYDFDYESDELVLAQALLLMSYWYESPDSEKDGRYWLDLAISTLEGIESTDMIDRYRDQKRWKRIWWSCYMQDRLIALCTRKPMRINGGDFHVDMLQESDFEIKQLDSGCNFPSTSSTFMRDIEMQKQAAMSISLAQLCVHIGQVLEVRYASVTPLENGNQTVTMLHPKGPHQLNRADVEAVEEELMSWASRLPLCCRYTPPELSFSTNEASSVIVLRMFLHILFYTILAVLHRACSSQAQAPSKAYDAAKQVSLIVKDLHQQNLAKLLPSMAVTSILTSLMAYVAECGHWSTQPQALYMLKTNLKVLEDLRQVHAVADYAILISRAAIKRVGIGSRQRTPL
ncbi:fungal-specific transcription factor domain-containing protein [Mariannaea sp. PMI_226]|nr:fungal-specific transcription factor domain-containing protein [Mariannaea sp. PMI_226]